MIRYTILLLALVAVFAAAGCATNRGGETWAPPASPFSGGGGGGGGSCPSCG